MPNKKYTNHTGYSIKPTIPRVNIANWAFMHEQERFHYISLSELLSLNNITIQGFESLAFIQYLDVTNIL